MSNVTPLRIRDQQSLVQAAIDYALLGFCVFPITPGRKSPPLVKKWPEKATNDPTQVRQWWHLWPNANIGIVTGERSGFIVLQRLIAQNGELPMTGRQQTGSGEHYLFSYVPMKNSVNQIAQGIDIRGDGGYIVAAPSVHPNGSCYQWIVEPRSLASPPSWMKVSRNCAALSVNCDEKILEGRRNDTLFRQAYSLKKQGKSRPQILGEIGRINLKQCEPPLSDKELNLIVRRVAEFAATDKPLLFQWRDSIRAAPICPSSKLILHEIGFHMDVNGKPAFPSQQTIADNTGLSRKTVNRKLREVEKLGLVRRIRNDQGEGRFNYIYIIPK